jgi:GT2 family glycosyltransferase
MTRPQVSVVMPFGGQPGQAGLAIEALRAVDAQPGDELILVDNSGVLAHDAAAQALIAGDLGPTGDGGAGWPSIAIVSAPGERSPAHARNVGADHASRDWILFLDADCRPVGRLLEAYFSSEIPDDVGAVAGELVAARAGPSVSSRYGAARNFLGQQAHIHHPYLPRAAAANLLVRRSALAQVGGFYEGVRAAEDTDFSWRLQRAGWRLELCSEARAEHRYRGTLAELRRQWRSYAAGRAWLARRYEDFMPEPAAARGLGRAAHRLSRGRVAPRAAGRARADRPSPDDAPDRVGRAPFFALDVLLAFEELAGFALSNRPAERQASYEGFAELVLVADRFPGRNDPMVELARTIDHARVEAAARPDVPDLDAGRRLSIRYLEDEGMASRVVAGLRMVIRHPVRTARDLTERPQDGASTWSLAPAVLRLERDPGARVHPLGAGRAQGTARRLAALAGRPMAG